MKVRLSLFALSLAAAIAWPRKASAQVTIASDSFELADHPAADRTMVTGGTNGLQFFTHNPIIPNYSVSIIDDSAPGGLGSLVLNQTDTTGNGGNQIIGLLPQAITLASPGDFIRLQFTFRYLNLGTATQNAAGFRFGIEGSNGTFVTADGQGSVSDNDQGYYVQTGVGATAPANNNIFFRESGTLSPILGGNDRVSVTANSAGGAINDILAHTASFTITRGAGTNISLSLSYDGGTAITGNFTGASPNTPFYTFDEIMFSDGFVANPVHFNIDNVAVVTNVPEPSAAVLGLLAVPFIAARRRRA
jgi:hypothetical protein